MRIFLANCIALCLLWLAVARLFQEVCTEAAACVRMAEGIDKIIMVVITMRVFFALALLRTCVVMVVTMVMLVSSFTLRRFRVSMRVAVAFFLSMAMMMSMRVSLFWGMIMSVVVVLDFLAYLLHVRRIDEAFEIKVKS